MCYRPFTFAERPWLLAGVGANQGRGTDATSETEIICSAVPDRLLVLKGAGPMHVPGSTDNASMEVG